MSTSTLLHASALDWLRNRLAGRIRATLASMLDQPLTVSFRVVSGVAP